MDSKKCASFLFVFLLAALLTARPTTLADPPSSEQKVSVALYYETMCPYSAQFITNNLNQLVEDDELMEIVDLRLVPYGNANILSDGSIVCQHGEKECLLNTLDACVIDAVPSVAEHFPFIHCVEINVENGEYEKLTECFDYLPGVDPDVVINKCTLGERGLQLEYMYANETASLQPPHEYVPWVTVKGVPLYEDYENFIARICEAYRDPKVPTICSNKVSRKSAQAGGRNTELKVCGRNEKPKATATNVKPTIPWPVKN